MRYLVLLDHGFLERHVLLKTCASFEYSVVASHPGAGSTNTEAGTGMLCQQSSGHFRSRIAFLLAFRNMPRDVFFIPELGGFPHSPLLLRPETYHFENA